MSWETSTPIHPKVFISIPQRPEGAISSFKAGPGINPDPAQYLFSDGKNLPASVRPGRISCSELPLILPDCICVQSCKLSGLFVSVSLLKELQAFLTLLIRNPLSEGRGFIFHFVLLNLSPLYRDRKFLINFLQEMLLFQH